MVFRRHYNLIYFASDYHVGNLLDKACHVDAVYNSIDFLIDRQ